MTCLRCRVVTPLLRETKAIQKMRKCSKNNLGNKISLDKLVAKRRLDDSTNEESKNPIQIGPVRNVFVEI